MKRMVQQSAHPWHGVDADPDSPEWVTAYIEIVPTDGVKYELDKETGLLRVDRPQTFSSMCPSLYGFIPRTYCGKTVAKRAMQRTGLDGIQGDSDPVDICVLSEKQFPHGNFLAKVRPIGGFRMIDGDEADDKIIAVLQGDLAYGKVEELADLQKSIVDRLRHYFLTYKQLPNEGPRRVIIPETYDRQEAHLVINRCIQDYKIEIAGERPTKSAEELETKAAAKVKSPKVKAPKSAKAAAKAETKAADKATKAATKATRAATKATRASTKASSEPKAAPRAKGTLRTKTVKAKTAAKVSRKA